MRDARSKVPELRVRSFEESGSRKLFSGGESMSSVRSFVRTLAALVPVQVASLAMAQAAKSPAAPPGVPPAAAHSVCLLAADEAALQKRETDFLGSLHAHDHAVARAAQCLVERGLRPVPASTLPTRGGPATLQEDQALWAAADALASPTASKPAVSPSTTSAVNGGSNQGRWSTPFIIPVMGVTSVLLHTGKVLFWSYNPATWGDPTASDGFAYVWDPASRTGHSISPPSNIFCAAQTIIADGRVFIAGGNLRYPDPNAPAGTTGWEGTMWTYTFVPGTETFVQQPNMNQGRWYPTATLLSDNRVAITSGFDQTGDQAINSDVEIFTPSAAQSGVGTMTLAGSHDETGLYPLQYLLPSASMLHAGPAASDAFLFNPGPQQWTQLPNMLQDHFGFANGVIFTDATGATPAQVVMVAGGNTQTQAITGNEWLDGNNPAAGWQPFPQWLQPRHNANTVILPNGNLLTIGGNQGTDSYSNPLLETELYPVDTTSTTAAWQTMAPHSVEAAYHSTAILLPDATVLLSQDDLDRNAAVAGQHKAQVFSPPYMFKGNRPRITTAPTSVSRGSSFSVGTDRAVTTAVLIAPGATTHANDMHQRFIRLALTQAGKTGLTAVVPGSAAIVPSGYYMLFVLNAAGIPSTSTMLQVL